MVFNKCELWFDIQGGGLKDLLLPSFSVRSSGGGWLPSPFELGSLSDRYNEGRGQELVNHISGKSRSERTCARVRWVGMVAEGRCEREIVAGCAERFSPRTGENEILKDRCILMRLIVVSKENASILVGG